VERDEVDLIRVPMPLKVAIWEPSGESDQ
jgi:hypothetical protein